MKKLDWSELRIVSSFIIEMQAFHRIRIYQKKRKKYKNVIKRKHQNKSYKYEKPKPNKHTEKGFYKNTLI